MGSYPPCPYPRNATDRIRRPDDKASRTRREQRARSISTCDHGFDIEITAVRCPTSLAINKYFLARTRRQNVATALQCVHRDRPSQNVRAGFPLQRSSVTQASTSYNCPLLGKNLKGQMLPLYIWYKFNFFLKIY